MSLFQQAAYLNNMGVMAILQGNYDVATSNMGHAVKLMQSELVLVKQAQAQAEAANNMDLEDKEDCQHHHHQEDHELQGPYNNKSSSTIAMMMQQQQHRRTTPQEEVQEEQEQEAQQEKEEQYQQQQQQRLLLSRTTHKVHIPVMESCDTIVFTHAIQIPTDITTCPTDLDLSIYSSVVIYNLALVFHFQASLSSSSSSSFAAAPTIITTEASLTKKAQKLYSMVLKLLDEKSMQISHTALLVKLACYNNLSLLRYSIGDYINDNAAKEGLYQITCWFMKNHQHQVVSWSSSSNPSSSSSSNNLLVLQDSDIQRLLVNALLLKEPTTATAA